MPLSPLRLTEINDLMRRFQHYPLERSARTFFKTLKKRRFAPSASYFPYS